MGCITCKELIEFLADYRDGSLPPGAKAKFDEHCALCPPCRDYLKTYEETIRLCRSTAGDPNAPASPLPPESLVKAILDARKSQG